MPMSDILIVSRDQGVGGSGRDNFNPCGSEFFLFSGSDDLWVGRFR